MPKDTRNPPIIPQARKVAKRLPSSLGVFRTTGFLRKFEVSCPANMKNTIHSGAGHCVIMRPHNNTTRPTQNLVESCS